MRTPRLVVVGSSNTDLVVRSDRLPAPGETVLGADLLTAAGGKGANQAVAAARLGADTALVARVGDDAFGDQARAVLAAEGIDLRHLGRDPDLPSGVALILVDADGENLISVAPGANRRLGVEAVDAAADLIRAADLLLLQLEVPLTTVTRAARLAARAGVRVILDPAPARPLPDELLALVDILTPNEREAEALTGLPVGDEAQARLAARGLLDRGASRVVVTRGAGGALLCGRSETVAIAAPKVHAADATAAGDTFNAALAVALAEGAEVVEAVRFAARAAAIAVTRLGAQPSMPRRAEVDAASGDPDPAK